MLSTLLQRNLHFFLLSVAALTTMPVWAQIDACQLPSTAITVDGGRVRALAQTGVNLFSDIDGNAAFLVRANDQNLTQEVATLFAAKLWVAAQNAAGDLKLVAPTFSNEQSQQFNSGPLDPVTGSYNTDLCPSFNRFWKVSRYQIAAHLADLADNGILDTPEEAVLAWPGKGNPYFESVNGFALPYSNEDMAPFFDADNDGLYDPAAGDYPSINFGDQPVENLVWSIYNTYNPDLEENISMEIRQILWTYACDGESPLNKTLFSRLELINRHPEPLQQVYASLWSDPDLGCYTDDYFGAYPAGNSCFIYNADAVDGIVGCECQQNVPSFCNIPPVQTITLLNKPISSFIGFYNSSFAGGLPPQTTEPTTVAEFQNYMKGLWRDGSPITAGGTGYMSGGEPVDFLFPDDPNDIQGWSMISTPIAGGLDIRTLLNTALGQWSFGEKQTLDVAFSFHIDFDEPEWLGQINVMYEEVDWLNTWYDGGGVTGCTALEVCQDDCVWAGDANADGIANHFDMLPVMAARNSAGLLRQPPYDWAPRNGFNWPQTTLEGVNFKHLDCDGNGQIAAEDFMVTTQAHYGLVNENFIPSFNYPEGAELSVETVGNGSFEAFAPNYFTAVRIKLNPGVENLHALAFTFEYDTAYFKVINTVASGAVNTLFFTQPRPGEIDMAISDKIPGEELGDGLLFYFTLSAKSEYLNPLPSNTTHLRLRNLIGIDTGGNTVELGNQATAVTFAGITVGTNDNAQATAPLVFPNPAHDKLHIIANTGEGLKMLAVVDQWGRQMMRVQPMSGVNASIDCALWPRGLYVLTVTDESGKVSAARWIKK